MAGGCVEAEQQAVRLVADPGWTGGAASDEEGRLDVGAIGVVAIVDVVFLVQLSRTPAVRLNSPKCSVALANRALFSAGVGSGPCLEVDSGIVEIDPRGQGAVTLEVEPAKREIEHVAENTAVEPQFLAPLVVNQI